MYCLSPNEEAQLVKEETEKRRRLRLQQVWSYAIMRGKGGGGQVLSESQWGGPTGQERDGKKAKAQVTAGMVILENKG